MAQARGEFFTTMTKAVFLSIFEPQSNAGQQLSLETPGVTNKDRRKMKKK
jgi:hypothetical protein